MKFKNCFLTLLTLGVLSLAACNPSTPSDDLPVPPETGSSETETESNETETETESEGPIEAIIEYTSNVNPLPPIETQDFMYYVGETVRLRITDSTYKVSKFIVNDVEIQHNDNYYPYEFVAEEYNLVEIEAQIVYATNPITRTHTHTTQTSLEMFQVFNIWPENSGLPLEVTQNTPKYSISYEFSVDTHLIDEENNVVMGIGYGDNDEAQINLPMYLNYTNAEGHAYYIHFRIFKWQGAWIYRILHGTQSIWSGDKGVDLSTSNSDLAVRIVKALSRGGVKFEQTFDGYNATSHCTIDDERITLGSYTLAKAPGSDPIAFYYGDFSTQFSANLTDSPISVTLKDYTVTYHKGE